jgi:hypothetical protein
MIWELGQQVTRPNFLVSPEFHWLVSCDLLLGYYNKISQQMLQK